MTPERWRQITEIFHAARLQPPAARNAFLDSACAGDASLGFEVKRLLDADAAAGTGAVPPGRDPLLTPGEMIGPYRIDGFIGAGGMGEVYRATDTALQRTVAIKILAPELATDPGWLRRFEREARVLAALNHPHIGAIYGLAERDGLRGLALEFVEGPTLADVIASRGRPGPIVEALTIARQIVSALEAAHGRGIVHRDLKPSNIAITPTRAVKVLDFGIAKSIDVDASQPERTALTQTATQEGIVLGTAAYMSPEQARGLPVDKRTDIWAFGCVLFEMLSSRRPFDGPTRSDTLARVLEREPDWTALPASVPPSIQTLVRRCLTKDPAERLHDIADARLEISEALATGLRRDATVPVRGARHRALMWAAIVATIGFIVAVTWWASSRTTSAPPLDAVEFGIRFPDNHIPAFGVAVSPDGRQIAAGVFGSASQLYLHSLGSGETQPLAGTQSALWPFWSPDGTRLAYFTFGRELRILRLASGVSGPVCAVAQGAAGGAWNRDGVLLFAADRRLFTVPSQGGTPTALPIRDYLGEPNSPRFLPDQRHFIYYAAGRVGGSVVFGSLDSPDTTRLFDADTPAVFVAPDTLLFVRGTALMAQRFDPVRATIDREPVVVATGVTSGVVGGRALISATPDVLAFGTPLGGSAGQLTWFDRHGIATGRLDQPPGAENLNPALSPDGTRVAVNREDRATGNWDIWIIDAARGLPSRLTTDPARDTDPVWSPDGREIVFASNRGDVVGLYRKTVAGSEPERRILEVAGAAALIPNDWSSDGRYILYSQAGQSAPGPWSVWTLPLADNRPVLLVEEKLAAYGPRLSPDGQWLAYSAFETERQEIYVRRFLAPGQKAKISQGGGVHPRWTQSGRELAYWAVPGGVQAVPFSTTGASFTFDPPRELVQSPVLSAIDGRTHYDIARDGSRLLVRQTAGQQGAGITVVLQWQGRLSGR